MAIRAFTIHENKRAGEDFDFEFDEFADESSTAAASSASTSSSEEDDAEELELHAEMLPANFENVEPPGVDHMEINSDVVPVKRMREWEGKMVEV